MKFTNSLYRPNPSGRLGSSIFSKNRYSGYEKMFVAPSQPRSSSQLNIRAIFASVTRLWGNTLTDFQRTNWDNTAANTTYTKNGSTYSLTGFNMFVKCNANLLGVNSPVISTVPIDFNVPDAIVDFQADIVATPGTEDITINFTGTIPATTKIKCYATPVLKNGRKPDLKKLRIIGILDNSFLTGDSVKDLYIAKYGNLPGLGQKCLFALEPIKISNGLANAKVYSLSIGTI